MKSFARLSTLTVLFIISACGTNVNSVARTDGAIADQTQKHPKNVILMIGDGMGVTQVSSGIYRNKSLNVERINNVGFSKTSSSAELITDSAAGATAFSIGEKTYNGAIGVDKDGKPKETLLELLGSDGYSTGLIATCAITHATPASFFAHELKRSMQNEIAADMVNAPVNLFIGGGKKYFENRVDSKKSPFDDRNIIKELEGKGFSFINTLDALETTSGKVGYFLADGHPESILKGRDDILPRSIAPSIRHLQKESDKGFFLVVEGSQIDWGGHENDSEYIITEMIDFDKAIGKALDFAEKDGNTLIVITADHETGGYSLRSKDNDYNQIEGAFTTGGHTGAMVPVFAYGPGSEAFRGIYNNNEIYTKIRQALGR
ncbi:alkaline phosphatase [Sinomicrobium weinanense]|uniref:Alkaline phosphatase n=2 Tax=Sinomicrobium weinanense TaxID=2842200 RepID=A0A926JVX5_9FLAO|nr:alkaline phosphatase [Sinomicrobium weinanense]MBC9798361.1 alkaline phosphatase [Sinomicrobium weinanense]MBU3122428.1 alkaline phosphatase [Sinomicrobium weinanense]